MKGRTKTDILLHVDFPGSPPMTIAIFLLFAHDASEKNEPGMILGIVNTFEDDRQPFLFERYVKAFAFVEV